MPFLFFLLIQLDTMELLRSLDAMLNAIFWSCGQMYTHFHIHCKVIQCQMPSCYSLLLVSACRTPRVPRYQLIFLPTLCCLLNSYALSCLGTQDFLTGSARLALGYFLFFFLIRFLVLQANFVASFIYVYLDKKVLSNMFSDT